MPTGQPDWDSFSIKALLSEASSLTQTEAQKISAEEDSNAQVNIFHILPIDKAGKDRRLYVNGNNTNVQCLQNTDTQY